MSFYEETSCFSVYFPLNRVFVKQNVFGLLLKRDYEM